MSQVFRRVALIAFALAAAFVRADSVVENSPSQYRMQTPDSGSPSYKKRSELPRHVQDFLREFQSPDRGSSEEDDNYAREVGPWQPTKYPETPMWLEQTAKECGEKKQQECKPGNFGGRTMCGLAVSEMIKCMKNATGGQSSCNGKCGHGKMFVDCKSGQMRHCGYEKAKNPTDQRCKMPGAVLAYTKSPTTRGAVFGHVEFVCGRSQYCSVYKQPHSRPWPRETADACWLPLGNQNNSGEG